MQPKDRGCTDWNEMQEQLANEIMELDGLDMPHRKIDDWIFKAHETNKDYILIVNDIKLEHEYPVYCEHFQDMHDKYNEVYETNEWCRVQQIIRVNHDGTAEENLQLNNLL